MVFRCGKSILLEHNGCIVTGKRPVELEQSNVNSNRGQLLSAFKQLASVVISILMSQFARARPQRCWSSALTCGWVFFSAVKCCSIVAVYLYRMLWHTYVEFFELCPRNYCVNSLVNPCQRTSYRLIRRARSQFCWYSGAARADERSAS